MDNVEELYNGLIEDGSLTPENTSLEKFRVDLQDEGYAEELYNGLYDSKDYTLDYGSFVETYSTPKNIDPLDTKANTGDKPNIMLQDFSLSDELFNDSEEVKSQFRTFYNWQGKPEIEEDKDGQFLKGAFGEFINMMPMGDWIDDQARAFSSGREDVDVQETGNEIMNQHFAGNKISVDQANEMLKQLYESQSTPRSQEVENFENILVENGMDGFAAVKAIYEEPSAAMEYVTRSISSMINWDNAGVAAATMGTMTAGGAMMGGPVGALSGFLTSIPAAMSAAGANTDMGMSYANFFAEELGEDYTREDLKALIEDQDRMDNIENKALARGVSIAAVSAFTAGIGANVAANVFRNGRRGIRASAEAFARVTPLSMAGGATGEALAQTTSGQDFSGAEVVLEGLLDPIGSIGTTIGGFGKAIASAPSYKINGGGTTKAEFIRRFNSMTDEQAKRASFEVNNDEDTFSVIDDRLGSLKVREEIKKVYGDMDEEQITRLSSLEAEKKKVSKLNSETAKKRAAEINQEIDEVVNIYKTKRDVIGILSAPYYDLNITSVEEAQSKRKTKEYKSYINKAKRLAETMNLTVSDVNDGIGGYFLDDGTYLQELSSEVYLEGATYEQAIEYASILGAITPETQESTIAGMIVGPGEGDAGKFTFAIEDNNVLEDVRSALDELKIEYSMNTDTGEIGIIDFSNGNDVELNEKLGIFVEVLEKNQINHEQKSERIRSKYIGAKDRADNLQQIKESSDKYGKNGESVRYIAEKAEQRNEEYLGNKTPPPPEETPSLEPVVVRTNVRKIYDALGQKKAIKKVRRFFLETFYSGGGLDSKSEEIIRAFRRKGTATQNFLKTESAIFEAQFELDTKKMSTSDAMLYKTAINDYLSGKTDTELSPEMKPVLDEMRSQIDQRTNILLGLLKEKGRPGPELDQLIETLENNKGSYLHRAYSAFKDLSYMEELLSDPSMARSEINETYDLLVAETAMDQGITIDEAKDLVDQYIADTFSSPDRGTHIASLADGKIASPFLKKKNQNLSDTFRKFLGEIDDPLFNYVNTIEKVAGYVASVEYQSKLSDFLKESGIATTKPNRDSGRTNQLQLGAKGLNVLDKLYVDLDFIEAFESIQRLAPIEGSLKYLVAAQGITKYGKTILSPTTTARNYISGSLITLMNGENILNPANWKKASRAAKLAWNSPKNPKEIRAEVQRLIEHGVLQDGGRAQEVMMILNDIYALESKRRTGGLNTEGMRKFNDAVTKIYQFGDDYFKTFAFYEKRDAFMREGMSFEEAEEIAAYRVRKGQPTYSELPKNMRSLRRFPLTGTFVSFPYLITKAHKENLIFIAEDFKAGRTKMAAKSLANYALSIAIPYGVAQGMKAALGISDEEDKALKDMAPKYYKDAQFIYTSKNEETNELTYFDVNSIAPSAQIIQGLTILAQDRHGRNLSDKIGESVMSQLKPYVSLDLLVNTGTAVMSGKDPNSGKNIGEDTYDRLKWGVNNISPGVVRNLANIARSQGWLGLDEINKFTGKQYTLEDELAALLGLRFQTTNWNLQLQSYAKGQSIDFANDVKGQLRDVKSQQKIPLQEVGMIVSDMYEKDAEYSGNLLHQIEVARKQSLTESEIVDALSAAGIRANDVNSLMKGEFMELKGIGTEVYKKEIESLSNRPDLADNMKRNLDTYQYLIGERNADGRAKTDLYKLYVSGADDTVVLDRIKKASKNIYKRSKTQIGFDENAFTQKDIADAEDASVTRYFNIYKGYKTLSEGPKLSNLPISAKATIDMIYERDPEIQSFLFYKFLDGKTDDKSINGLNTLYKSITKKNMSKTVLELLVYRIKQDKK